MNQFPRRRRALSVVRGAAPAGSATDRLDADLSGYFDQAYNTWAPPAGAVDDTVRASNPTTGPDAGAHQRLLEALRDAPAPQLPRQKLRHGVLAVGAAAASVVAITVALSTLGEPESALPDDAVLLTSITPGGERGVFAEHAALQRCLAAAQVPAGQSIVLGAGPISVRGSDATALLLPGPTRGSVRVLAVKPACADGAAAAVLVNRTLSGAARASAASRAGTTP